MVSTSSKIALASLCPRTVWLQNKYGSRETKEIRKGETRHELFAKDVEHALYVKSHRKAYMAAAVIIILIVFGLLWLMLKGVL